jgi:hypothetical protein
LTIGFPAPLAQTNPEVLLDGKRLTRLREANPPALRREGNLAQFEVEPDLYHHPVVLDIRYRHTPSPAEGGSAWQTLLEPPVLGGSVALGPLRWQVDLPWDWICLSGGQASAIEARWVWRGALLTPVAALTEAHLDEWFRGEAGAASAGAADEREPALVGWRSGQEPLALVNVPREGWLLGCSLALLGAGLGLGFLRLPRVLSGVLAAIVVIGVAVAAVQWPRLFNLVLYGCEPGLVVLGGVVGVHWWLRRRYQRRLVFLPAFTRVPASSAITPRPAGVRQRGEPSTVDGPPQRESSVKKQALNP